MRLNARLLAAFAASAIAAAGLSCSSNHDPTSNGMGQVHIVMSAAAAPSGTAGDGLVAVANADGTLASTMDDGDRPRLQSANVTFTSIMARNLEGQLVAVNTALPTTVDVLAVVRLRVERDGVHLCFDVWRTIFEYDHRGDGLRHAPSREQ